MSGPETKAAMRLLRFLRGQGDCSTEPVSDGTDRNMILTAANGHRMLATREMLGLLVSSELLDCNAGQTRLTALGERRLKRAETVTANDPGGFGGQHRSMGEREIRIGEATHVVAVNNDESPLTRLRSRRDGLGRPWIDDAAYQAGERLRRDFTIGGLMQKVTASWDMALGTSGRKAGAGAKADLTDSAMDARHRLDQALDIVGPDLAGVLTDFCCFLKGLETIERDRKWPPRSAKLMLRTGLDLLARFYGLEAKGPARGRMQSWGAEGYRPEIGG